MAHLVLSLCDKVNGPPLDPALKDDDQLDFNLNTPGLADKAAQAIIERGNEYRRGDHIRLFDHAEGETDTIAIDYDVNPIVNLNKVILNDRGFADRAARVQFVHNPTPTGEFRLRVRLYDQDPGVDEELIRYPTLIFYDWDRARVDLSTYHLKGKTAFAIVEKGGDYLEGDVAVLLDSSGRPLATLEPWLEPEKPRRHYSLPGLRDQTAYLEFPFRTARHLTISMYDSVDNQQAIATVDGVDSDSPEIPHARYNLNKLGVADRVARLRIETGPQYHCGDHIRLSDQWGQTESDTISIDPDVLRDERNGSVDLSVDLNEIFLNDRGFADRAASLEFVTTENVEGRYRLRVRLFEVAPGTRRDLPTLVFYDWQAHGTLIDLNKYHFADKTAYLVVEPGDDCEDDDCIALMDSLQGDIHRFWPIKEEEGYKDYDADLNRIGLADKAAAIRFDRFPRPRVSSTAPEWIELVAGPRFKLVASDPGPLQETLNDPEGNRYGGRATSVVIHGAVGSTATFFDDRDFGLDENAVRIKKLSEGDVEIDLATNFVNSDEEKGDGIYAGIKKDDASGEPLYQWTLFKHVKRNWLTDNIEDPDRFLDAFVGISTALAGWNDKLQQGVQRAAEAGVALIEATGVGDKTSDNYRVDNCSSISLG